MNKIRLIILIGQLGRIMGKKFVIRQASSVVVAIGFYMLFVQREKKREKYFNRIIEEDELTY